MQLFYVQPVYFLRELYEEFQPGNVFLLFNTFDFLVNIEYAKVLKQLCWEILIYLSH